MPANPENSVRMGQQQLNRVLDELDRGSTSHNVKRSFTRWTYRQAMVDIEIEHPGGSRVTLSMATRNLSRGGLSVLHSAFVYPGSRCVVALTDHHGVHESRPAEVMRCTHLHGKIHELGLRFDEEINAARYIKIDRIGEGFSLEKVDPKALTGEVLIADPSPTDMGLISAALEGTGLTVQTARGAGRAVELASRGYGLIIAEFHLDEMTAGELVGKVREQGVLSPVLVLSTDTSTAVKQACRAYGVDGFLSKPFEPQRLLGAIAELMESRPRVNGQGKDGEALGADDPVRALIPEFLQELDSMRDRLAEAAGKGDVKACVRMAQSITGRASPLGFVAVGEIAANAANALLRSQSVEESGEEVAALIEVLGHVTKNQAA